MNHHDKVARLKQMLQQVAPEGSLETLMAPTEGSLESTGLAADTRYSEQEIATATSGLRKLQEGRAVLLRIEN